MNKERKCRFEERFRKYYPLLCGIARHYIKNMETCEDIVQDLFVKIWDKEKDMLPEDEFLTYVTIAVRNNCITILRKQQRAHNLFVEKTEQQLKNIEQNNEEEQNFYIQKLQKMLLMLPPKCREVFVMSKIRKMKYKEIAEELDIREKTVENHITKAYKLIREYANVMAMTLILFLIQAIYKY